MSNSFWQAVTRGLGVNQSPIVKTQVEVTTNTSVLFTTQNPGLYRIWLKNTGATVTNSCKIQGRSSSSSAWLDVVSTSTEFTTIPSSVAGFLLVSDDTITPTALASNAEWTGQIDATKYLEVRMIATVAAGSTRISVEVN